MPGLPLSRHPNISLSCSARRTSPWKQHYRHFLLDTRPLVQTRECPGSKRRDSNHFATNIRGCIDQSKFLSVTESMTDVLCQICHQHTAATFDGLISHILRDHDRVETKLVAKDHVYGVCHYGHLGFACDHNEPLPTGNRFDGPLGRRLYHTILGEVLKCHYGLPFASVQHLALRYKTCSVNSTATTAGPSLKAWYMHAFGINHGYHDFAVNAERAGWMVQDVFSDPTAIPIPKPRFSKLGIDADTAYCRKLRAAPGIVLVRDSRFATVSWTPNKQKSVGHWTRQYREVFNLRGKDMTMAVRCSLRVFRLVPSEATSEY